MFQDKFCIHDSLLSGFSFDELITTVLSNEKEVTEQTVTKVFNEIVNTQMHDARYLLKEHMQKIINEVNSNK